MKKFTQFSTITITMFTTLNVVSAAQKQKVQPEQEIECQVKRTCIRSSEDQSEAENKSSNELSTPSMNYLRRQRKKRSRVGNLFNVNELERHKTIKRLKNGDRLDLDQRDEKGNSLLHLAAKNGSYGYGNMLIHLGLSLDEKNNEGKTPVIIADEEKNDEMILLFEYYKSFFLNTVMGNFSNVKKALQKGVFVNVKFYNRSSDNFKFFDGNTALHLAAALGHEAIVRLLLVAGADVNDHKNEKNNTPLLCACANRVADTQNHEGIVQQLLNAGASTVIGNSDGATPLHFAAVHGKENIIQRLLTAADASIAINGKTIHGHTPLHCATNHRDVGIVQRLLAAGADKTIQDTDGKTALDVARENGHEDVVALLE